MGSVLGNSYDSDESDDNGTTNGNNIDVDEKKQIDPDNVNLIHKEDFKIFVGMDFGTNGFGLAYSLSNELTESKDNDDDNKQNIITHEWQQKLHHDYLKKKAHILLDKNGEIKAFGEGATIAKQALLNNNLKLIQNIKMKLYDDPRWHDGTLTKHDNIKLVDLQKQITSNDGLSTFDAEQVFVGILKQLKEEAKYFILNKILTKINKTRNNDNQIKIIDDDIQWILTIPAIWSYAAKNNMKEWGIKAGLLNKNIVNQLRMVLEPECAALHIQYLINTKQFNQLQMVQKINYNNTQLNKPNMQHPDFELKTGDKYILVDAGGGTVDIVSHQVIHNFGVKEVLAADGGAFGAVIIDREIMTMFYELFGEDNVNNFAKLDEQSYTQFIENCNYAKCQFAFDSQERYHGIEIPMKFVNYLQNECKINFDELEKIQSLLDLKIKTKEQVIEYPSADYLRIHRNIWEKMFDCCIDKITFFCDNILDNDAMNTGQCKYLFMCGGFASSPYFQQQMYSVYGDQMKIIIPSCSILTVVKGAARFGIIPDFILSRKLTKSYAIEVAITPEKAQSIYNLPVDYIKNKNNLIKTKNNKQLVKGVLNVFARKNQEIDLHFKYPKTYSRLHQDQDTAKVMIYCSDNEYPKIKSDAKRIGSLIVQIPKAVNTLGLIVEFSFNDTILCVHGYPTNHPNKRKPLKIIHDDPFKQVV